MLKIRRLLVFLALAANPALGAEALVSIGITSVREDPHPTAGFELRSDALTTLRFADLGMAAAVELDAKADFWTGVGIYAITPARRRWRADASVMIGYYAQGDGESLGTDFPMFRSEIGVSRALRPGWRLRIAANHKSNARSAAYNPGVETILVSLGRAF